MPEDIHPQSTNQQLVENPFLGEPVVRTPSRMNRREGVTDCPFCADIAAGAWPSDRETWVRPNDFPPLQPPLGECFVLLYARAHNLPFAAMSLDQVVAVVDLWREVYLDLSQRYACVMTFENSGTAIGQTQYHPHGQTYGIAFLPPIIERELAHVTQHLTTTGACLFCRTLAEEAAGARVVVDTPHWLGFIPAWARYPYEVQIYARQHISDISTLEPGGAAARELAEILLRIVRGWNTLVEGAMPYFLALHQLADPRYHLHLELLPVGRAPGKLKYAASAETAFGLWLNDALPEVKAQELRDAMP